MGHARKILPVAILGLAFSAFAQETGDPGSRQILDVSRAPVRAHLVGKGLKGLEISLNGLDVQAGTSSEPQPIVTFQGAFDRENWALVVAQKELKQGDLKSFRIPVPISRRETWIALTAIGPRGEQENESLVIDFPGFELYSADPRVREGRKTYVLAGIGVANQNYSEPGLIADQISWAANITVRRLIAAPSWDLRLVGSLTLAPLSSTNPTKYRTLGFNLIGGYVLPIVKEPWRVSLLAGWYMMRMLVQQDAFGLRWINGPELYPSVQRYFGKSSLIQFYGKYSPVAGKYRIVSISKNREIGGGILYQWNRSGGSPLAFSVDYQQLQLEISGASVNASTWTGAVSYGLY